VIIDAYAHVAKGVVRFYEGTELVEYDMSVGSLLSSMNLAGIDKAVICGLPHKPAEASNDFIARLVEAHPDRFIGFAIWTEGEESCRRA